MAPILGLTPNSVSALAYLKFVASLVLSPPAADGYLSTAAKVAIADGTIAAGAGVALGATSGAGGATAGMPRQLVSAGAAGVGVVAALALALTAGDPQLPQAAPPPSAIEQPTPLATLPAPPVSGTTAVVQIREAPSIECQTIGSEIGGDNRWDRTDRGFVADRYIVRTGTPPAC